MKAFKYKFSIPIIIAFCAGIVLSIACLALNAVRVLKNYQANNAFTMWDWLILIFVLLITIGFIVVALTTLLNSKYIVKDKTLILKWGILSNKTDLKDISSIRLDVNKKKLELIYSDESYFVVSTKPEWFESFVDALKMEKPDITFIQETN